ncbi:thiamine transport system substrate-binding protein [Halorubrum alkaliphilum]|uniref:Thiamine transport system substrate-binding protein n=1 Tax=Halorubrum alkaliphilum TaxID=261290 RepID=A0A8T4GDM4_9EURY|nr:thiamine ABC transporter substrate-binding protein [Halorubrum alkaliphilum]MBP1922548.1 thiamine transport system substrate-binding protein [Halorubrum alkaliphilum]
MINGSNADDGTHSRREFIALGGAAGVTGLAGCSAEPVDDTNGEGSGNGDENGVVGDGDDDRVLTVGTFGSFVDAPSISPGEWLKDEFESRYDAELQYATPDNELNYYVERAASGAQMDADLYVGVNTEDLVQIDEAYDGDLFVSDLEVDGDEEIRDGLRFDPFGRTVPYDTGYVSLVYDSTETEAPETFEGLLEEEHRGDLIAQNPGSSTTGLRFVLHTVHRFGDEGEYDYLDFWADLQENDVRVTDAWDAAYTSWSEGEAPMVVSYSTDQVFASQDGADLDQHQIRFLNDEAYATPSGMALFEDAENPELARQFMSFMLEPDVQGEIVERNVSFPATETAELPADYDELAHEPDVPVTFDYDELQGSMEGWVSEWERQLAGN